eukprot:scaffold302475_cov35-Tisochrysis_lutea.AAC.1
MADHLFDDLDWERRQGVEVFPYDLDQGEARAHVAEQDRAGSDGELSSTRVLRTRWLIVRILSMSAPIFFCLVVA